MNKPFIALIAATGLLAGCTATTSPRVEDAVSSSPGTWRDCPGLSYLKCLIVAVGLKSQTDAQKITVRATMLPARGKVERTILVSPGGPGVASTSAITDLALALGPSIQSTSTIIGIDARGTGGSETPTCLSNVPKLANAFPSSSTDRAAWAANIAKFKSACVDDAQVASMSTASEVRDIEAVRSALGIETFTFVGLSYGSYIGERYMAAHPNRVTSAVFDGPVDATAVEESTSTPAAVRIADGGKGAEAALLSAFDTCGTVRKGCTGADVKLRWSAVVRKLLVAPVSVGQDGSSDLSVGSWGESAGDQEAA